MTGEQGPQDPPRSPPPAGSVAEEAAKLLGALQGWATEAGTGRADAAGAARSGAARALHDVNEHIATGGQECTYCPVCQVISLVRGTSPEVKQHLTAAATSLVSAAAGLLATHVPKDGPDEGPLEHIDISEDDEWEDD